MSDLTTDSELQRFPDSRGDLWERVQNDHLYWSGRPPQIPEDHHLRLNQLLSRLCHACCQCKHRHWWVFMGGLRLCSCSSLLNNRKQWNLVMFDLISSCKLWCSKSAVFLAVLPSFLMSSTPWNTRGLRLLSDCDQLGTETVLNDRIGLRNLRHVSLVPNASYIIGQFTLLLWFLPYKGNMQKAIDKLFRDSNIVFWRLCGVV